MSDAPSRVIGRVIALRRFPVKSMGGERVDEVELGWTGISGDREYAFVRDDQLRRFPWATGRDLSRILLYRARACGARRPTGLPVEVGTPDGRAFDIADPALVAELAQAFGGPVRPLQLGRGAYDSMPLSILSTGTLDALAVARGAAVDPERFRMNVLVDAPERDSEWRGGALRFGADGPVVAVTRPVARCAMITIDPVTAERDPSLLRLVAQAFGNAVGEYASVLREGTIRVGDEVRATPLPA